MNPTPPPPAAEAAVLDEQALGRLRELDPDGRHGVVQRVLQTFVTSLDKQLGLAAEARDRGDAVAVGNIAHMLKSSSASVGALTFSARCAALEKAVRSGTVTDLPAEVENLLTEGRRALAAVRAILAG